MFRLWQTGIGTVATRCLHFDEVEDVLTMVHVLCVNGNCGRVLHLDNFTHWNYDGEITCPDCESIFMLTVKDGQVASTTPSTAP
jgi:uncharacterized CHY-type Zn-finger protein